MAVPNWAFLRLHALRGISARALDAAIARCEEVAPGPPTMTGLLSGPPALAVAESGSGASMLVVGARGAGGFAAMVLGSVSRYAATRAPCPVVVVLGRHNHPVGPGPGIGSVQHAVLDHAHGPVAVIPAAD